MSFISPVVEIVKKNSCEKNIEHAVNEFVKFNQNVTHCNFCNKPVGVMPVYENADNTDDFSFDDIVKGLCCDEMRSKAEDCRKDHIKNFVEYRIKEIDIKSTPAIYRRFRISDFPTVAKKIREFAGGLSGKGLYIFSLKNGTGKTTLSCVSAKTYCAYWGYEGYKFMNYPEFVSRYEQYGFDEKYDLLELYKQCRILIIDDLGKGRLSPMSISNIYDIVNFRNINQKMTIVSSNLSLEQISESFDSSVASRLFEMCDLIEMKGNDMRINPINNN